MVKRGDFGLKTGRGFYDHTPEEWQAIIDKRDRDLLRQLQCSQG